MRMLIVFFRGLTGKDRTPQADRLLGLILAFVAGATNAGGFLAVHQYTSHMTGIVAAISDNLALGDYSVALAGVGAFLSFLSGAACSAILINWARHRQLQSVYAMPLMLEAGMLLLFGLVGANLSVHMGFFVSLTVMLLCFIMGLQNSIVTKLSNAGIRTTHVTGVVTDIGIELGKLMYWNRNREKGEPFYVGANHPRLRMQLMLLTMFCVGGLVGALGFKRAGFSSTIFLAVLLMLLAFVPVMDDVLAFRKDIARVGRNVYRLMAQRIQYVFKMLFDRLSKLIRRIRTH